MLAEMRLTRRENEKARELAEISLEFQKGAITRDTMLLRIVDTNSKFQSQALATGGPT